MLESVALVVQQTAKEAPDRTAFIVGDEYCSYERLARINRQVALWLRNRGIKANDRIIIEADHSLPYVFIWYGIQLLGATFVPVEKNTPDNRLAEICQTLDAVMLLTLKKRESLPDALTLNEVIGEAEMLADDFIPAVPDPESLAAILFTTGTTGKSKGVMVTFSNQVHIALAGIETTGIQTDNNWLVPTPMNHAAALRKIHMALAVGSTVTLLEGFTNFREYFRAIHRNQVTSLYLPPSAIHLLLTVASAELEKLNGQLRFIYSGSALYPEVDKEKMRKLMPDVRMFNAFGSSEAGVVCADEFCVSGGSKYAGSVGKPNSYIEILILDDDKKVIEDSSAQKVGLIAIRSRCVMKGYWNEPELNAESLQDGVLVTSDMGYRAPNGEVILVGRSNDTINLGGLKVAPSEVESLVMRVSCVDECLLIPAKRGSSLYLKLLVVLKEGEELNEAAIRDIIAKNLEPYKIPKQIVTIDGIIRAFNGKIDRKQMIAKYA